MKAKVNEKAKKDFFMDTSFKRRNYYFHADEDFREDHSWGKQKSKRLINSRQLKKENT